jgi:Protein of unknown function (DUF1203)
MSDITYIAIDPGRLDAMRQRGADEFGNPWKPRDAEGWEPLRCCLRKATAGEQIALISYSPWSPAWTPWAEAGPVFVHFHRCAGYLTPAEYPPALLRSHSLLNPFDHTGARAYEHIRFVEPGDDHAAAVQAVMDHPDVAYLHVRSAVAQCFTFEVRRA